MATKKKEETNINIPALSLKEFDLRLVGTSPLICHKWSEKAKKMILDKQMKKAAKGRDAKRPIMEFAATLYWFDGEPDFDSMSDEEIMDAVSKARFGFPTLAFKASAIAGAFRSGILDKMTVARGAFHVQGELAEIKGTPEIHEANVKIGISGAEMRYRAIFHEWETSLHIVYNEHAMSLEQICNLFQYGGFACGVGDWRPERDGSNGMYRIG